MMHALKKSLITFVAALAAMGVASCTDTPKVDIQAMVPPVDASSPAGAAGPRLAGQVALGPVGGRGSMDGSILSSVSAAEFQGALDLSLSRTGYLAAEPGSARYLLDAYLIETIPRDSGPTFHLDAFVRYKVTDSSGAVLVQEIIRSETLATVGEVGAGGRAYMERVIQANISGFLQRLAELERELAAGKG